ncbi:uncharacterized protein METZ01_LOCUS86968 [marine metagenome]|uniref:Uncharacterized protein n=1 Tax=marine metagenome TaxID=408172 RepID=A0A381V1M3_9ZZZZ
MPHYSFEIHNKILYKKRKKLLVYLLHCNIKLSSDIILLIVKYISDVSLSEYRMESYIY